MPVIFIRHIGANLAYVEPVGAVDPGFGHGGGGVDPDYGMPAWLRPGHDLPGGGHISNRPPGSGGGGIPGNELPPGPPPVVAPGLTLVLVRDPVGVWHYATIDASTPPPKPVPPGDLDPGHPANKPPGSGAPPTAGTPLPPSPQPKR